MSDSFKREYLGQFPSSFDATTYDKMRVPDPSSTCLNCDKPGTVHINGKCPFEASQFEASTHHYPFAKYREAEINVSPFGTMLGTSRWRK